MNSTCLHNVSQIDKIDIALMPGSQVRGWITVDFSSSYPPRDPSLPVDPRPTRHQVAIFSENIFDLVDELHEKLSLAMALHSTPTK